MHKILIVDDNRGAADSLVKLLTLLGHDARAAYDGLQALDVAVEIQPDVIFLDLLMPDLDGFDVLAKLRMRPETKNARIVALTGVGGDELAAAARQAGFDLYMQKPATADTLIRALAGRTIH